MGLSISEINKVKILRNSMVLDAYLGNYKNFKNARKEYAALAIKDMDTVMTLPRPSISASIFTKPGLNIIYVMLRELFRKKTPEEKLFKQMCKEAAAKQKINQVI